VRRSSRAVAWRVLIACAATIAVGGAVSSAVPAGVPAVVPVAAAAAVALVAAALVAREVDRDLGVALRSAGREAAAEREAAETERERLATIVRELSDAVLISDDDERIRFANPAAEGVFGPGPLVGRRIVEVVRDHETIDAIGTLRTAEEVVTEVERHDPPRSLRVVARRLAGGEILLAVQDLTRLRRLETVRRDFVANVSHELRTPIASIKAMVEALEGGALRDADAARDFLRRIHTEVDGLAQLVNELLDLSRAESGAAALDLEDVAPADLAREPIERLAPLASRSGLTIEVADLRGLPQVRADRQKVSQVLMSLLHNAVKFTPAGGRVVVSATRSDAAVRFAVSDTGIGLRRDEVDRVFERFYKGERSRSGSGTGLGLAIAKHVVQAHGGTITAESEGPGRGSTFSFTLPVAR
jgi:two-component system phosphate regulon sensor histidine kinase PhoR